MDHTYQRPLQLPAGYSVLSAEEMTYTEGGAFSINITPQQVMAFGSDDAMQKKWKAFCRKIDTKTDDFNVALRTIDAFLNSPFAAAVQLVEYSDCWSASSGKWSKNRGAEL